MLEGDGEFQHVREALLRVFLQGFQHDTLHSRGDGWDALSQRWWRGRDMLDADGDFGTAKGRLSTQPLINHHSKGILFACRKRISVYLFWSHVSDCSTYLSFAIPLSREAVCRSGNAEIGEPDLIVRPEQDILRFDIAVDDPVIVRTLQGAGDS